MSHAKTSTIIAVALGAIALLGYFTDALNYYEPSARAKEEHTALRDLVAIETTSVRTSDELDSLKTKVAVIKLQIQRIIDRAEAFASKNDLLPAAQDGFWMGLGMTSVLVVLGAMREVIGNGTLFDGADLLLGEWATSLRIEVFQFDNSFLLALLPPGAFIRLRLLIGPKYVYDKQ